MERRIELTLTLHGLEAYNEDVDGEVFARKLGAFLRGIKHSDITVNGGKRRHKLLLTQLSKNTATASVREQVYVGGLPPASGMEFYENALDAVYHKRREARNLPFKVLKDIVALNTGAGHTFKFGEFKSNRGNIIRIDEVHGQNFPGTRRRSRSA